MSEPREPRPAELIGAPRFDVRHQLLSRLPVLLVLAIWGGGLLGGSAHLVLGLGGRAVPTWLPFLGAGLALVVALPALTLTLARRAYRDTRYVVTDGRLELDEGLVALAPRTLALRDVTRIRLVQGPLQRRRDLGTLILSVAAATDRPAAEPVRLLDLPEPERALARLRELVASAAVAELQPRADEVRAA